jgi:hypothetical protein
MLGAVLSDLRESGEASAAQKRWHVVLDEGTWAEVLRRMVLARHGGADKHR